MPRSRAPPPTRWMPWKMMSWASSGGAATQAVHGGGDDLAHLVLDRAAQLPGRQHHRLGHARHQLATAHLGLDLAAVGRGGPDGQLDLLGGALADGDAVLAAHVGLDGGVDVEPATADRLGRHHAAERDDRGLRGATAHVHHHVADGLVDGEPGTDGRRHGLLDEVGGRRPGPVRRLLHGPTLDARDGRRHADEHAWTVEPRHAAALQQQADHPLGDVEVGDGPLAQGSHGHDVPRRAPDHLPGVLAHGQDLVGPRVEGDHRRLVQHDALAPRVDEGVGRTEVDGEVPSHVAPLARRPCYG